MKAYKFTLLVSIILFLFTYPVYCSTSGPYSYTINICNNCYYYMNGYYVDPYYYGLYTYNISLSFNSVHDDTYVVGITSWGCSNPTTNCDLDESYYKYFIAITPQYSGNFHYNLYSPQYYPLFTFGGMAGTIQCKNSVQSCQIQVTQYYITENF